MSIGVLTEKLVHTAEIGVYRLSKDAVYSSVSQV